MIPVALTIAGSDPGGGAGIQADLKTFHSHDVYGEAVITLITVQNTLSVSRVELLSAELVAEQIQAVISDIRPQAAKTGALGNAAIIRAVAQQAEYFDFPLVVDPVMISKHGARLITADATAALLGLLLPKAALVTPNVPEAEELTGASIRNRADMPRAARRLLDRGCRSVLIKGGHLEGDAVDLYADHEQTFELPGQRFQTAHTHGTGCTYSAAITAELARGVSMPEAVRRAKEFISEAIRTSPGLGGGCGPVNHFARIRRSRS